MSEKRWSVETYGAMYDEGAIMRSEHRFHCFARLTLAIRRFIFPCFQSVIIPKAQP